MRRPFRPFVFGAPSVGALLVALSLSLVGCGSKKDPAGEAMFLEIIAIVEPLGAGDTLCLTDGASYDVTAAVPTELLIWSLP